MSKKKYFRKEVVPIPTFGWNINVVVTSSIRDYCIQELKDDEAADEFTAGLHFARVNTGESYIILSDTSDAGNIAHECWHAIRYMLTELGVSLDNEVVAYHLGYLVRHAHDVQNRFRKQYGSK